MKENVKKAIISALQKYKQLGYIPKDFEFFTNTKKNHEPSFTVYFFDLAEIIDKEPFKEELWSYAHFSPHSPVKSPVEVFLRGLEKNGFIQLNSNDDSKILDALNKVKEFCPIKNLEITVKDLKDADVDITSHMEKNKTSAPNLADELKSYQPRFRTFIRTLFASPVYSSDSKADSQHEEDWDPISIIHFGKF